MNTHVIDSFRYRADDVLRDLSANHIKAARAKEIEIEMMNSTKLKVCFFLFLLFIFSLTLLKILKSWICLDMLWFCRKKNRNIFHI